MLYMLSKHLSMKRFASLAQLDRASVYGTEGQEFESLASHQNQIKEKIKLGKKNFFGRIIKYFSLYEYLFILFFSAAGIAVGIITEDMWLGFICLIAGIFCEMLLAKRNRANFFFSIINDIFCGVIAIKQMFIMDIVMNFAFWVPNDVVSIFLWNKHKEESTKMHANVRQLKWWHFLILYGSLFALAYPISLLLSLLGGNMAYLDALGSLFEISTGILIMLRFKNHYIVWLTAVLIQSVLYGIAGEWLIVLMNIGYVLIAAYGYFNWERNIKKQQAKLL